MKNAAYYNGKISLIEEMTIPLNDRVVYFGDGVYEAAYVRGHKVFALYDHLDRLYRSLSMVSINFDIPREELTDIIYSVIDKVDDDGECFLYWSVTRGTAMRNHIFPEASVKPNLIIYAVPKTLTKMSQKLKLITYEDERYLYCNIKTLNLLPNVLASQKAAEAGCNEAVFHRGDIVTECAHSNISILKGGVLRTAPLTKYILPGTVRKQMLELARENDIPIDETAFTLSELLNADEVIVTSTTLMIHGTESIDGKAVGGKDAATLGLLQDAYMRRVDRELK